MQLEEQDQGMYEFVEQAKDAFETESTLVNIEDYEFLIEQDVPYLIPWIMPEGNNMGSATINNIKGIKNGLIFRPLGNSMRDIHDWWYSDALTQDRRDQYELKPESTLLREADILKAWKELAPTNS